MPTNPPSNSDFGMTRRQFGESLLYGLGGVAVASTVLGKAAASLDAPPTASRPNLVLVMSDQHAARCCGFAGHAVVRTPNLDRIAQAGTVFSNSYCGSPVCAPSRAGMLSGVYPSDCNSFCNATVWDAPLPAWPRLLHDAGYRTFGTGKMDANDRFDMGFDEKPDLWSDHAKEPDATAFFRRPLCFCPDERRVVEGGRARANPNKGDAGLAVATVDFIRRQAKERRPWAAYCGPHMPHPPFVGLQEHFEYYLSRVELPKVPADYLRQQHPVFEQLRNFKDISQPVPEDRIRAACAAYYAMITELDAYVGQIWSALAETGQLENTIFVYTSDHGESLGEHGLWLKNNIYEVAARVPLVVAGAGVPRGGVVNTPVAHVDLIRTFLEWGGAETPRHLRGHSLRPLLQGRSGDHPGWAYTESHSEGNCTGSFLIRKGDWKYIHITWDDGLLFNLAEDPGELHNRIADPAAAGNLSELRAILHSQVDPVEVTERAFRAQRRRLDELAAHATESQMVERFQKRLGKGQAINLLTAYYGHPLALTPKA